MVHKLNDEMFSTRRLEALTDGVFAIAMTLLVLDLKVTEIDHVSSSAELWQAILRQQDTLAAFVISFFLLGSMWAVHMRQFEHITTSDRQFISINTIRLLIVVLIPLTTSISGDYQEFLLGRILLPLNLFALVACSFWQWNYAVDPKHPLYDTSKLSQETIQQARTRNIQITITAGLAALLSIWFGLYAFFIFFLTPPIFTWWAKRRGVQAD